MNVFVDSSALVKLYSDEAGLRELAQILLASALDRADLDAEQITAILDAIPGAWERTQEGLAQARRGEGIPLDDLIPARR